MFLELFLESHKARVVGKYSPGNSILRTDYCITWGGGRFTLMDCAKYHSGFKKQKTNRQKKKTKNKKT